MKTVDFIRGIEWQILEDYGFHATGNRHIDCPICGSKKKFRIHDYNGAPSWICTCGNGGLLSLIQETTGRDFAAVAKEIDDRYGNKHEYKPKPKPKPQLASLSDIKGTQVERYLNSRGIYTLPKYGVMYAANQYHYDNNANYGAMYSLATDYAMKESMIHRTYLEGGAKIEGKSKKMEKVRESQNLAVKMFDADVCLGIGEGIESSLSASQLFKVPVWATLSTSIMKGFRAPRGVKNLVIYADNDRHGAGLAAAFDCANKNLLSKNDVVQAVVKWPESGDFNDHLLNPKKIFEWKLAR